MRFALGFALREGVKDKVEEDEEQDEFEHETKLLAVTDRSPPLLSLLTTRNSTSLDAPATV